MYIELCCLLPCLYTKESRSRDVAVGIEDRRGNCHLLIDVAVRATDGRGSPYSGQAALLLYVDLPYNAPSP
jgi:hypothetical protein